MNAKQLVMIKHHRSQTKPWHREDETAEQIHTHAGKNIIKKISNQLSLILSDIDAKTIRTKRKSPRIQIL